MNGPVVLGLILRTLFSSMAYDVERPTKLGPVGGRKLEVLGTTIEEYRGIPYAEPPVGELRFKPPVPAKAWDGTLDASSHRTGCPQLNARGGDLLSGDIKYGEDCLHLNVWTAEGNRKRPVLVWIHGGGFNYGSASYDNYTGAVIAAKTGLVVASMNYRLGVLGFLNADTPEAPGNVGLLDQNLALKWIKKNIRNFGGDPTRITLFGESAGAMSVHAHLLSPMSGGLFHRAIAMSGVMVMPDFSDPVHRSVAKGDAVAAIVGCRSADMTLDSQPDSVIDCLRTRSADELVVAASEAVPGKFFPFVPTYHDQFLPKVPAVAVRKGFFDASVDLLTGVTSDEGATALVWPRPWPELLSDQLDSMDRETLKSSLTQVVSSWMGDDAAELLEQYAARSTDGAGLRRQLVDYLGDRLFVCPMHAAAAAHASRNGSVYSYVFDQWSSSRPRLSWAGVGHGMDLLYTFGLPLLHPEHFDDQDARASENLISMIATFAEKGVPEYPAVPAWPKYSADSPVSLRLAHDSATEVFGFGSDNCDLFRQYF